MKTKKRSVHDFLLIEISILMALVAIIAGCLVDSTQYGWYAIIAVVISCSWLMAFVYANYIR